MCHICLSPTYVFLWFLSNTKFSFRATSTKQTCHSKKWDTQHPRVNKLFALSNTDWRSVLHKRTGTFLKYMHICETQAGQHLLQQEPFSFESSLLHIQCIEKIDQSSLMDRSPLFTISNSHLICAGDPFGWLWSWLLNLKSHMELTGISLLLYLCQSPILVVYYLIVLSNFCRRKWSKAS